MNPVLIVTGGSRGIGAATCRLAAKQGYNIAVNYRSDEHSAGLLVAELEATGIKARSYQADIANEADCVKLFKDVVATLGVPSALVNSAGINGGYLETSDFDAEKLNQLMQTNVIGTMLCCREAVGYMSTRSGNTKGAIVNLSSMAATIGGRPGSVAYAASKAAVDSFTTGLAKEVGKQGIRVNAVRPGVTLTDMTANVQADPALQQAIASSIAMNRVAQAEEIAAPIMWLLSSDAAFVSGCCLDASGGGFVIGPSTERPD